MSESLRFTSHTTDKRLKKSLGVLISYCSINCAVLFPADAPETENQNHNRADITGYNSSWIHGTMSIHGRETTGRLRSLSP